MLYALLVSTGLVALAEIGDKTQLLALLLAARFRAPMPIIAGIFVATVVNHAGAAVFGAWAASLVSPELLRIGLGLSFLGMAAWMLVPDKADEGEGAAYRYGPFVATVITFFLAEMGDKTQIATVMLAAKFDATAAVVFGTTLGMMLANAPVVWLGNFSAERLPLTLIHAVAAFVFALLGVLALVGWPA